MRLLVQHATIYTFAEPQARLVELLRVTPSSFAGQNVVDWQIDVDCDARLKSGRDGHGNETVMLYINGPVRRIRIAVSGEVLTDDRAGMVSGSPEPLPPLLYTRASSLALPDVAIADFARVAMDEAGGDPLGGMHRLMARLNAHFTFDRRRPVMPSALRPRPSPRAVACATIMPM